MIKINENVALKCQSRTRQIDYTNDNTKVRRRLTYKDTILEITPNNEDEVSRLNEMMNDDKFIWISQFKTWNLIEEGVKLIDTFLLHPDFPDFELMKVKESSDDSPWDGDIEDYISDNFDMWAETDETSINFSRNRID